MRALRLRLSLRLRRDVIDDPGAPRPRHAADRGARGGGTDCGMIVNMAVHTLNMIYR